MEWTPARRAAGVRSALAFAACLLLLLAAGLPERAAAANYSYPDLVATPPDTPSIVEHTNADGSHDLILRFDGYIYNAGPGALEIHGNRATASDPMSVSQCLHQDSQSNSSCDEFPLPKAQLTFATADGHNHWHLQGAARYSLWNWAKTAEVAPSMKVGFCLDDTTQVNTSIGPSTAYYVDQNPNNMRQFCRHNQPDATTVWEGISAGWQDIYYSDVSFQWVVISDTLPGLYYLREDVNPDNFILEANDVNPPAWSASTVAVPGYNARPIAAPTGRYGRSQQITLGGDEYPSVGATGQPVPLGPRRFRIVTPPTHGTLNVTAGSPFSGPQVVYTPAPGYIGRDEFTYQAFDSNSPYPHHPATATVNLVVGAPPTTGSKKSIRILGAIKAHLRQGLLTFSVKPHRAGIVSLSAGAGGHRLRSCLGANRKRRTFKCRVHLRGQPDLLKLKIVARLIDPHGVIARVQRVGPPT